MPDINVRNDLIGKIKPLLPKAWRLIPYGTNLDTLDTTCVMVTIQSIERHPAAPMSHRLYSATFTILQPLTAPGRADDALDDDVIDLLNAIDQLKNVKWTKAERGLGNNGNNLGFDITIEVPYGKDANNG